MGGFGQGPAKASAPVDLVLPRYWRDNTESNVLAQKPQIIGPTSCLPSELYFKKEFKIKLASAVLR